MVLRHAIEHGHIETVNPVPPSYRIATGDSRYRTDVASQLVCYHVEGYMRVLLNVESDAAAYLVLTNPDEGCDPLHG